MSEIKIKLEAVNSAMNPKGDVAYLRMPIQLNAFEALNLFIEIAYGKGCECSEDPKGWLKVRTTEGGNQ